MASLKAVLMGNREPVTAPQLGGPARRLGERGPHAAARIQVVPTGVPVGDRDHPLGPVATMPRVLSGPRSIAREQPQRPAGLGLGKESRRAPEPAPVGSGPPTLVPTARQIGRRADLERLVPSFTVHSSGSRVIRVSSRSTASYVSGSSH